LLASTTVNEGRQSPAGLLKAEHARNMGLEAPEVVRILIISDQASVLAKKATLDPFDKPRDNLLVITVVHA
jgi:hypothetical protein